MKFYPMDKLIGPIIAVILVLVHAGLLLWAITGLLEFHPDWTRTNVSNPLFSPAMLLWQWLIVAATAVVYLALFAIHSNRLPETMAIFYGLLALTCVYQTFFILEHPGRFWQLALEIAEYTVILLILFHMPWFQRWQGR
ncbi:MAG: hypothetical protein KDK23_14675 [Leptospiraceae bacterium]|nr:hypothetical protein [Leptospiraceae bacterium]